MSCGMEYHKLYLCQLIPSVIPSALLKDALLSFVYQPHGTIFEIETFNSEARNRHDPTIPFYIKGSSA